MLHLLPQLVPASGKEVTPPAHLLPQVPVLLTEGTRPAQLPLRLVSSTLNEEMFLALPLQTAVKKAHLLSVRLLLLCMLVSSFEEMLPVLLHAMFVGATVLCRPESVDAEQQRKSSARRLLEELVPAAPLAQPRPSRHRWCSLPRSKLQELHVGITAAGVHRPRIAGTLFPRSAGVCRGFPTWAAPRWSTLNVSDSCC